MNGLRKEYRFKGMVRFLVLLTSALTLAACTPEPATPDGSAEATAQALAAARFTQTAEAVPPTPSQTALPTETATASLTPTATHTFTPAPTATPVGTGGLIAFTSGGNIYLFDVGSQRVITIGPGTNPTWSADGRQLIYMTGLGSAPKVMGIDVNTRDRTVQADVSNQEGLYSTVLGYGAAPDGGLYFAMDCTTYGTFNADGSTTLGGRQCPSLYYQPPGLDDLRSVYLSDLLPASVSVSPDGSKLAFIADRVPRLFRLYVYDSATLEILDVPGEPRRQNVPPVWSPDGHRLAYSSKGGDATGTLVYDLETEELIQLTSSLAGLPAWSPDGRYLAYSSGGEIFVHDFETAESRQISADGGLNPSWSPDSGSIAYSSGRELFLAGLDGSAPVQVTLPDLRPDLLLWSPLAGDSYLAQEEDEESESTATPTPETVTQESSPVENLVKQLYEEHRLSTNEGEYYSLPESIYDWAQLGWYEWHASGYAPANFVLDAYVSWEVDSDTADWETSGCGFVFRENGADNHYLVAYTLGRGYLSFSRVVNGAFADLGGRSYGIPSAQKKSGGEQMTIIAEGSQFYFYVSGLLYHQRNDMGLQEGNLNFAVLSGTNEGFGVRCTYSHVNLFVPASGD